MRFCKDHWAKMKAGVEDRGLGHLVAKSGEAAVERVVAELEHRATDATFDPLMTAHWMIVNRALECGGLYLMTHNPDVADGEFCPLCEVAKHTTPPADDDWIKGCLDAVRDMCVEKGLVVVA